ncbi:MAG: COX15/CtaA family protein, partial [Acidobacteriaceae bacterium]|nr:COX15/CtaA family protein [Acidobacteriaceae bacterium]
HDQSAGRAFYLSAHLTNTLLLLGALTLTAWLAYTGTERFEWGSIPPPILGAAAVIVAISITGAIAALGDTLFPAASLAAGMRQDFSSASSGLLRLRSMHPIAAILGAGYVVWVASHLAKTSAAAVRVIVLVLFQLLVGAVNIGLLAPVWMQLIHLLIADVVWIAMVVMMAESGRQTTAVVTEPRQIYVSLRGRTP